MSYIDKDVRDAMARWEAANEEWETAMEADGWVEVETQEEPEPELRDVVPEVPFTDEWGRTWVGGIDHNAHTSFTCSSCGAKVVDSKSCPCNWKWTDPDKRRASQVEELKAQLEASEYRVGYLEAELIQSQGLNDLTLEANQGLQNKLKASRADVEALELLTELQHEALVELEAERDKARAETKLVAKASMDLLRSLGVACLDSSDELLVLQASLAYPMPEEDSHAE